jgi:hypothetical protein
MPTSHPDKHINPMGNLMQISVTEKLQHAKKQTKQKQTKTTTVINPCDKLQNTHQLPSTLKDARMHAQVTYP